MTGQEGVIKYVLDFTPAAPPPEALVREIAAWRRVCRLTGLIGQDPDRYEGYGFGNISARIAPGQPAFVISGSQTGHLPDLGPAQFAMVEVCEPTANRVVASGPLRPSSEAMTHGTIYALDPGAGCVIHAHAPTIWQRAAPLGLLQTGESVPYGSPEMAAEVARLFRETAVRERGIFCMAGHEDGVVAFGPTAAATGTILLVTLARSFERA